ncbi:MAG: sigma-70 family RNA polymerase sigma factor [Blautia sp.]|nr:sigma-70 family RNA polymerase sigma factor [Blautia sp.]
MHISWNFLDKRKATIEAIKSYDDMAFIIEHTDEEIATVKDKMVGVGSPGMDGLPHAHNPKAGEDRLVSAIDEIDLLRERYRQAVEYMAWFKPAWNKLTEDEQFVLEAFYMGEDGSSQSIQDELNLSQSGAYNKKNRALNHLIGLLYGKA